MLAFPSVGSLEDSELLLFTDASYANLSDKVSSAGGYLIFLKGKNGSLCPISWASKKIKRVVKSTLAAEALALVEGLDACYFVRSILHEMIQVKHGNEIPIKCYTDNKSLSENIHSTKLISEKRLRLDLASIKESVNVGDIEVIWVRTSKQISDCLTKAGADFRNLVEVLSGQGWQNPGIYEYFPSRRELLVNPGIYLGNTGYSGKFNFHDNQKVKTWIDTYFSIYYGTFVHVHL